MEESHDHEIVMAVLGGDVNAYRVLVQRYQKPVFNLLYRMTGSYDNALDLSQETFVKAYENLESFKVGARFFPWLYTIGLNHGRNFLRKNKAEKELFREMREGESWLDCPGQQYGRLREPVDMEHLRRSLQQLPLEYREAVMLHYREGLTMEEIARTFRLSVSGAKMRVHRGLQKLRKMMDGDQSGGKEEQG